MAEGSSYSVRFSKDTEWANEKYGSRTQSVLMMIFLRYIFVVIGLVLHYISSGVWRKQIVTDVDNSAYWIYLVVGVSNTLYFLALKRGWFENIQRFALFQIVVDIIFESALCYCTGGISSQFVMLYILSVLAASLICGSRYGIIIALTAGVGLFIIALIHSWGNIEGVLSLKWPESIFLFSEQMTQVVAYVSAFVVVAFLAGNLMERMRSTNILNEEILENMGDGLLVISPELRIVFGNRELLAMSKRKILEDSHIEVIFGKEIVPYLNTVRSTDNVLSCELSLFRVNDTSIPVQVRLRELRGMHNETRGIIAVVMDLRPIRKMEDALRAANKAKALSTMSAGIAHEIRNPLASIRGSVQEISRDNGLADISKELISIVISESDRIDGIISEFLTYSRSSALSRIGANLVGVTNGVIKLLNARDDAKNVNITIAGEEFLPIIADASQIHQALLNLGINALNALRGKGNLSFNLSINNKTAIIRIKNDGPKIEESDIPRLFEPFFTRSENGTGLGLSVVHGIVSSHEGVIEVSSTCEKTEFKITLPLGSV